MNIKENYFINRFTFAYLLSERPRSEKRYFYLDNNLNNHFSYYSDASFLISGNSNANSNDSLPNALNINNNSLTIQQIPLVLSGIFVAPQITNLIITGNPWTWETLTATFNIVSIPSSTISYQWFKNDVEIMDVVNDKYFVQEDDLGANIKVRVTANQIETNYNFFADFEIEIVFIQRRTFNVSQIGIQVLGNDDSLLTREFNVSQIGIQVLGNDDSLLTREFNVSQIGIQVLGNE